MDEGIWFCFKSLVEHDYDVMVLSDYYQDLHPITAIDYKLENGIDFVGQESVWDITRHNIMVTSSVNAQDYNYCDTNAELIGEVNILYQRQHHIHQGYHYEEQYKGVRNNH